MYKIYIDGLEVDYLVNSKMIYTWFLCIDSTTRRVKTHEYEIELANSNKRKYLHAG